MPVAVSVTLDGNGNPVTTGNPLATHDASATLSASGIGTPADTTWSGTGSSTIIAALKALWTALTGTIKTQLQAGANAIGTVSLTAGAAAVGTVGVTALPALPAGANQIGLVTAGGFATTQQATPTVQAAAYAAGNVIGGLITLAAASRVAAGSGLIQSITASFVSGSVPALDVIFFNASPTGSTVTDKTALAVATADLGKIVGIAHLTDSTLLGAATPSLVQALQQAIAFQLPSGTALYAAVVTRTAITLTSVSDMILTARILAD